MRSCSDPGEVDRVAVFVECSRLTVSLVVSKAVLNTNDDPADSSVSFADTVKCVGHDRGQERTKDL